MGLPQRPILAALGFLLACAGAVLAPGGAWAQEAGELRCPPGESGPGCKENDAVETPTIVVTGTKTVHPVVEAPVPTQVITGREIEEFASDDVEDVLSQVPDIYVRCNEQFALGASTVRMQGLDANKVAIVLDGMRFRGGIDGVVDLRDIPSAGIEQIEIIRGPASSLYGSDAMAGVVNIRTRTGGLAPYFKLSSAGGTQRRQLFTLSHAYHLGPVRYSVTLQHNVFAPGKLFGPISAQFSEGRSDDLQKRDSALVRLDYPTVRQHLRLTGDFLRESNPLSHNDNRTLGLSWTRHLGKTWTLDITGSVYDFARKNTLPGFAEDVAYTDLTGETRLTRVVGSLLGADHVFTLGTRLRRESLESPATTIAGEQAEFTALGIDAGAFQISPFLQNEALVSESLTVLLGLSLDNHDRFGLEVNPRVSLTWRPSDTFGMSFAVGRGFRAPDLLQLFDIDINGVAIIGNRVTGYALVGNEDLNAETDLGFTLQADYAFPGRLQLHADAFLHELDDLIGFELVCTAPTSCRPGFQNPVPDLDGQVFSVQNVGRARTRGVDVSVTTNLLRLLAWAPAWHRLELGVGFALLDSENLGDIAGERGKALPFRPALRILPSVAYRSPDRASVVRVWGEFEGRQFADLANSPSARIADHWIWNFKVTQELSDLAEWLRLPAGRWLRGIEVFFQGENVFDRDTRFVGPMGRTASRASFMLGVNYAVGQ